MLTVNVVVVVVDDDDAETRLPRLQRPQLQPPRLLLTSDC
jgi:hypothetical protein